MADAGTNSLLGYPWVWRQFGGRLMLVTAGGGTKVALCAAQGQTIQTCDQATGILRPLKETDELAHLVAAAPDLLGALKGLLPEGWGDDDTMDHMPGVKVARLAIAKAEGRS